MIGSSVAAETRVSVLWTVETVGAPAGGGADVWGMAAAGAGAAGAVPTGAAVVGVATGATAGARDAFGERSSTGAAVGVDAQPAPSAATNAASMSGRENSPQRKTIVKPKPPQSAERN